MKIEPLDEQLQLMLDAVARLRPPGSNGPSVADARRAFAMSAEMADTPPEAVAATVDFQIPSEGGALDARSYRGVDAPERPPVLVWYHGGGWVIGDLETADRLCRRLANRTGALVVSVAYRLAPEHPAPAAIKDAWDALCWVASHGIELECDTGRLGVGGDSAGGNLAALVALRARDEGHPSLRHQLLVYPATDLTRSAASHAEQTAGLFDSNAIGAWFDLYLGEEDPLDPAISPAAADPRGLPPACVLTAGHDPLRDEGFAYVDRLRAAGVAVEHVHHPSMMHGFLQLGAMTPVAAEAIDACAMHVRSAL